MTAFEQFLREWKEKLAKLTGEKPMNNLEKAFGLSPADLAANEALDKRVEQARKDVGLDKDEEDTQKFLEDFIEETERLWGAQ